MVLGWAPVPPSGLVLLVVGAVAGVSVGVQGVEPVPGGGEVLGRGPAGRDLQDFASGVGDQAGRGGQQPEPQGLGRGFGQVVVEGEVAQPRGQRGRQGGQLQPGGVAVVVYRGQVAGAAGLELLDSVLDVGLGAVTGVEPLDLPGGGVGGERAVLPVGVVAELGRLAGRSGDAAGGDPQVARPGGQLVAVAAGPAQDPGQVGDLRAGVGDTVGVEPVAPVALAQRPDRAEGLPRRPASRSSTPPEGPACRAPPRCSWR